MSAIIGSLSDKVKSIPEAAAEPAENAALREICDLMASLNDRVRTVSETLSSLSEEV